MARRGLWIVGGSLVVGLVAASVVWATWPAPPVTPDWSQQYDTTERSPSDTASPGDLLDFPATYDLVARPADAIAPGTIVETKPPPGWSHLIIKSLPRIREDQKELLPALTVDKASWMFTAFLANVTKESVNGRTRHRFQKLGLGLGAAADKGRDTILTADTAVKFGAGLGLFNVNAEILDKGYEVQRKAVLVFSGPTMGLLDTPVWFRCGQDNRLVRYRYALLVDPASGRLDTLLWRLGNDDGIGGDLENAVWLKPNTVDAAELVVDRQKVRLGIPGADAFAVTRMPVGRPVPIPTDLRPLAGQTRFTAEQAHALDTRLRKLLK
ncbi:MAG TPA: hypothetical protein VN641_09105 [Urbifossiella sp.]|nr:hypothetical protein [Urbifossiella sp.]